MTITLDDPRLTAYALNELENGEQEEVENAVQNSQSLQREIEAIRLTAGLLSAQLATEVPPQMQPAQSMDREFNISSPRRRLKVQKSLWAIAAAILIGSALGIWHFRGSGTDGTAFAQTTAQIVHANTITWKETVYSHSSSKDGQNNWLVSETREIAYKSPGLYRETRFDDRGQIRWVEITDAIGMRQLDLNPKTKFAELSKIAITWCDPDGPWTLSLKEALKANSLQWVGPQNALSQGVNIFRYSWIPPGRQDHQPCSNDFWIDSKTKRLVEFHAPGADIYDPNTDPTRNNPHGVRWTQTVIGGGQVDHDIVYDAPLDDSLFRLDPPADYTLETKNVPLVTEQQMIDFYGLLAGLNDNTFPNQAFNQWFSSDKINEAWAKPKNNRSVAEQKFLDAWTYYVNAGLNELPPAHFILVQKDVVPDSFHYFGKGVKLGDKDRIVCWYRLVGSDKYRVLYGDLSVKDVAPADLPLPDQP